MKNVLVLLIILFGINSAFAKCAPRSISFYPRKNLNTNTIFIIEAYGLSQKTVESFRNRIVFLQSEADCVELELQEIHKGQMELTQAIFKPKKALQASTKYYLHYSNQTEDETAEMKIFNPETGEKELVFWETTATNEISETHKGLDFQFVENQMQPLGCGPSVNAIFKVIGSSSPDTFFKTEVMDRNSGTKSTYYLTAEKEMLYVGHDMCAGAFRFSNQGDYQVRFTPVLHNGKKLATSEWMSIGNPATNAG